MSATHPATLGKYEIRGTLGKGAMGIVYDGWDPVIDRRVAIKTVRLPDAADEEAVEGLARFKREAQAAGRLTHPNIVGVFDYGETADVAYIVMEFVEGRSLKEVLGANERMAAPDAVRLMEDVLAGLTYSHSRGVVHRDIKPANIMMTLENRAKIADFGVARIEASSMTQAGTVIGTPAYMSPEQFMGQVVDRRTDIYSCGVMLYQLLTGERPFEGSMTAIMHKAMTTTPPKPSELAVTAPTALDPVVARAMARRPEDRYNDAAEFAQALRAPPPAVAQDDDPFASDETVIAPRKPAASAPAVSTAAAPGPPAAKGGSKLPLFAGAAVAALAVAGAAAFFLMPGSSPGVPDAAPARQASLTPLASQPTPPVPQPAVPSAPQPAQVPSTPLASSSAPPVPASPFTVAPPAVPPPAALASSAPPAAASSPAAQAPSAAPSLPKPVTSQPVSVPPPTPNPPPAAPPTRSVAEIEAALASGLPGVKCSLVRASVADGAVTLTGVAGAGQPDEALRRTAGAAATGGLNDQAQVFDGPYCPALDLLRPVAEPLAQNRNAQNRNAMEMVQAGGPAPLKDNDVIALQVTMPAFAGYLHVAYLQHDATVAAQVPGPGYPAQTYAAHAQIELGRPRSDFDGWRVGPPFGTDMIVAVASTAPLFSRALPESQPLAAYLAALQTAMDALRRRGGSISAAAVVLDTRPGP